MGGEILTRLGDNIASLKLIPGAHGVFDVRINGQLVGEHTHGPNHEQYFPETLDILQKFNEALAGESLGVPSGAPPHSH